MPWARLAVFLAATTAVLGALVTPDPLPSDFDAYHPNKGLQFTSVPPPPPTPLLRYSLCHLPRALAGGREGGQGLGLGNTHG